MDRAFVYNWFIGRRGRGGRRRGQIIRGAPREGRFWSSRRKGSIR